MSGTLGPAKSWRVVYNDDLLVTFFKETDGMLYTGQSCFEYPTREECVDEARSLNLKFECWKFWTYPDNFCSAPVNFSYYEANKEVPIGEASDEYGYITRQTYQECIDIIQERGYVIR